MSADRAMKAFRSECSGASAVEFAIVLPVFLAIIFGIFQFGWAQHSASSLRYALEHASRALLLNPTMSEGAVRSLVMAKLQGISDTSVAVTMTVNTAPSGARTAVIAGTYSYSVGVPTLASYPINYATNVSVPLP